MIAVIPNLRYVVDSDGGVILDIPNNKRIIVDPTGGYIWKRLQNGEQIDAIAEELARITGADFGMVAKDVDEFVTELKSQKLVIDAPTGLQGKGE